MTGDGALPLESGDGGCVVSPDTLATPLPPGAAAGRPGDGPGTDDPTCDRPSGLRPFPSVERPERRRFQAIAGRLLLGTTSRFSMPGLHAFARRVGSLGSRLPLRESRITRVNIRLCFPELTEAEHERLARESLEEDACMFAELGHLWFRPVEEVLARVVEVRGEEHLLSGLERGRGGVVAGPHLGAWELLGLWMGRHHAVTSLYRRPLVRELEEVFQKARGRSGARLYPASASGLRAVCSALRRGGVVGILPDQDPGPGGGVFVPFFGIPANSSLVIPRVASRLGATVLLAFAERLPRGAGYRIQIRPGSGEIAGSDLVAGARALSRDVESLVRTAPAQYLWSYKRFRIQPPGSPELYPRSVRTRRP
jgi:Kdo2-lipid IVA lauroyltransferase/acyltransferase